MTIGWPLIVSACADCGIGTIRLGEWYMVRDDVWEQAWRRPAQVLASSAGAGGALHRLSREAARTHADSVRFPFSPLQ
jgi:hypothetical protein